MPSIARPLILQILLIYVGFSIRYKASLLAQKTEIRTQRYFQQAGFTEK